MCTNRLTNDKSDFPKLFLPIKDIQQELVLCLKFECVVETSNPFGAQSAHYLIDSRRYHESEQLNAKQHEFAISLLFPINRILMLFHN